MKTFLTFLTGIFLAVLLILFSAPTDQSPNQFAESFFPRVSAFGVNGQGVFSNYQTWSSSANFKPGDTLKETLDLMYNGNTNSRQTLTDINGDGLTDVLYHDSYAKKYAVLLNTGNLNFDLIYKCLFFQDGPTQLWYGDCADA